MSLIYGYLMLILLCNIINVFIFLYYIIRRMFGKKLDEKWALNEAVKIAKNSKCKSKRGVVIWNRTRGVISSGWNAPPLPFKCDGSRSCRENCSKTAIHAEQAALMGFIASKVDIGNCEMIHVKIVDGKAVVSDKPSCWQCSKLILASGLKAMWLYQKEGYIKYTPDEFHKQTLINCELK